MTSETMGFVPPHNFEAEQSVLGGLMLRADAFHDLGLTDRDFYSRPHQIIFEAISQLVVAKHPVDIMTVQHRIEQVRCPDKIGQSRIKQPEPFSNTAW